MDIIEEFLEQYSRQYDFYSELARIGYKKLENELGRRGIKSIVSYRAKNPDRLRDKLVKRKDEKKYTSIKDIYSDIIDLAGVRIALYFPSDRDLIDEIVHELFEVRRTKKFPESSHKPKHSKRFSGYWATHYNVELKPDKENKRYNKTPFEIQVASVLMHGWAEVEHDLVYKPLSGELSEEELAILDEINGLVLSGEIALERLQKAITKRTTETKNIADRYEMTNFIVNSLNKNYIDKLKLGDTKLINNYFKTLFNQRIDFDSFSNHIKNINQSVNETISDQLLNMLFQDYFKEGVKDKSMKGYFSKLVGPNKDTSGFESFVKTWIILEKANKILILELNVPDRTKKYNVPHFNSLNEKGIINKHELDEILRLRRIRNQILHGVETPDDIYLNSCYIKLREITAKIVHHIKDERTKSALFNELNEV